MGDIRKLTADDFDSPKERADFARDLREGLDPEGVFDDFGDNDEDDRTWPSNDTDVHCSDENEVRAYYDDLRPSGWFVK